MTPSWAILATILGFSSAVYHAQQQPLVVRKQVFGPSREHVKDPRVQSHGVKVQYETFEDVFLGREPNMTLSATKFLLFDNFQLVNVNAANEKGFLDAGDMNCAVTYPNAIFRGYQRSPAVIRANQTALAAAGFAPHFDVIAFSWKTLGIVEAGSLMEMNVFRLEQDGSATLVDGVASGAFTAKPAFQQPLTLAPPDLWPGWGERVNWLEVSAFVGDEALPFCMDSLVLLFYAEGKS